MSNIYGIHDSHVFITGGAGFIGTTLASRLADDNQITLFDNLHNDALKNTALKDHPRVRFIKGDILDSHSLAQAIDPSVEYVIHCAAIAGVDTVLNNPLRTLEVNLLGLYKVLEASARIKSLKRFVDFSTSEVYGQRAYNVNEQTIHPLITVGEARWTYSISKLAGEFLAHSYHKVHHLPTVTIRPFNVYGPNQVGVGAIHHFILRALAGEDVTVHNDGMQIRAWCYIDDFVHGVLLAMMSEKACGKAYNIGNPRSALTTYCLARLIMNTAQSTSNLVFKKLTYPDVEIRIPDITAARTDFDFQPKVDIEDGVERTINWYRTHHQLKAPSKAA
ncbi:MAG TPA: NAD-dependent epimerase/dehydratase family protein [Gemmataceae bacterium]|jgi:nucleoside-diphosphate-sugar epimerase|nr:NAD-dependent epimerase/dehydratase family protein [Gemmataceae bacterium]